MLTKRRHSPRLSPAHALCSAFATAYRACLPRLAGRAQRHHGRCPGFPDRRQDRTFLRYAMSGGLKLMRRPFGAAMQVSYRAYRPVRRQPFSRSMGEKSVQAEQLTLSVDGRCLHDSDLVLNLPCVSVPQLLRERSLQRLDLLHCDVQGAETEVLESCRDLFARNQIAWVFVSTHHHSISGDPLTHQRCVALLRDAGAKIFS